MCQIVPSAKSQKLHESPLVQIFSFYIYKIQMLFKFVSLFSCFYYSLCWKDTLSLHQYCNCMFSTKYEGKKELSKIWTVISLPLTSKPLLLTGGMGFPCIKNVQSWSPCMVGYESNSVLVFFCTRLADKFSLGLYCSYYGNKLLRLDVSYFPDGISMLTLLAPKLQW